MEDVDIGGGNIKSGFTLAANPIILEGEGK
jgi:hypothetical protein